MRERKLARDSTLNFEKLIYIFSIGPEHLPRDARGPSTRHHGQHDGGTDLQGSSEILHGRLRGGVFLPRRHGRHGHLLHHQILVRRKGIFGGAGNDEDRAG